MHGRTTHNESLAFGPDPAQVLEPFDRCVAAYDASPDPVLRDDLLKTFGYVVLQFDEYAGLPLARSLQIVASTQAQLSE